MTDTNRSRDDKIDYKEEGSDPGGPAEPKPSDRGYDEAARSGDSRYGVPVGEGGVFGTTGGGTFGGGMQIVERPLVYEHGRESPDRVGEEGKSEERESRSGEETESEER